MKVKITEKGARDRDGTPMPVGMVVALAGQEIPGNLINKCVPAPELERVAVTNPKRGRPRRVRE